LGTVIAIWWQLRYQPLISSTSAAVIFATEPIFASLWSWLLQEQVPQTSTLFGAGFILAGMLLSVPVKKVFNSAVTPLNEQKNAPSRA
jgi:drug/metabolite transporter (DMT)-like permease